MNSLEAFLAIAFLTSILNFEGNEALSPKCDFRRHPKTGCDNSAYCEPKSKQCVCKLGYVLTMSGECLRHKQMNDSCVSSLQCRTPHSACLAVDGTYNAWKCQCLHGFWFDKTTARCLERYRDGEVCTGDYQCKNGLICAPEDDQNNTTQTVCKCPTDYHFNSSTNECQHQNNSGCPSGQQWNRYNKKCETNNYSNRSGVDANSKHNAVIKNKVMRPTNYWTQTTATNVKDEDTDEKILEIILEISFLIVCLLAYQACSKACCPDDTEDEFDMKSDEESMISSSQLSGSTSGLQTAQAFRKGHRRVRKVFCKSRGSSQQKLIGSSPSHKYKNIIVKFDDTSRAQCYNCKIYKEVYSPNAKCKVCRASITATGGDPDLDFVSSDGKQLLPLPPYKLKPIRRSEEVGVPPHLKAPYVNNQPFWLK